MPSGTWLQVITKTALQETYVNEPAEKAYETAGGLPFILANDQSSPFDTPILTVHPCTSFTGSLFLAALSSQKPPVMHRLIFLLLLVLLGINGLFFWKARATEPAVNTVCQIACAAKEAKTNGAPVLPGALVVFM